MQQNYETPVSTVFHEPDCGPRHLGRRRGGLPGLARRQGSPQRRRRRRKRKRRKRRRMRRRRRRKWWGGWWGWGRRRRRRRRQGKRRRRRWPSTRPPRGPPLGLPQHALPLGPGSNPALLQAPASNRVLGLRVQARLQTGGLRKIFATESTAHHTVGFINVRTYVQ